MSRRAGLVVLAPAAGVLAAAVGWLLAEAVVALLHGPGRLQVDLPVSAGVAAAIVTWRWRVHSSVGR